MNSPEGPSDPSSGINHPHHLVWRCLFLLVESGFHEAGSLLQALRKIRYAILGNFTTLGSATREPCFADLHTVLYHVHHLHRIAHKMRGLEQTSDQLRPVVRDEAELLQYRLTPLQRRHSIVVARYL